MNAFYIKIILKCKKKSNEINYIYILISLKIIIIGILYFLLSTNKRENYIFNEKINLKFIKSQNDFCENKRKTFNYSLYMNKIQLVKASINDINFNMYIYKEKDTVSSYIRKNQNWEKKETNIIIEALNFYTKKNNIRNKNAYVVDIGANIGWYTLIIGKLGFNVLAFEPSNVNYFILNKNYCLNKNINITLINKGLFTEEIVCDLYAPLRNEGNGFAYCNKNYKIPNEFSKKIGEIKLSKLQKYIPFLSKRNLILIKIDAEGSEGKAFKGGIEIITKYHVPFIFMEFNPILLKDHGTEPTQFLKMFINNGYKISINGFLSKKYISPDDKILFKTPRINIYIIYEKVFE